MLAIWGPLNIQHRSENTVIPTTDVILNFTISCNNFFYIKYWSRNDVISTNDAVNKFRKNGGFKY